MKAYNRSPRSPGQPDISTIWAFLIALCLAVLALKRACGEIPPAPSVPVVTNYVAVASQRYPNGPISGYSEEIATTNRAATIAWNPIQDGSANFFTVFIGPAPRFYTRSIFAGTNTSASLAVVPTKTNTVVTVRWLMSNLVDGPWHPVTNPGSVMILTNPTGQLWFKTQITSTNY